MQKAGKGPEKKASPLPTILSAIAIIVIVIIIYHVVTTSGVSQPSLSTKDPADVATGLSDLPSGWSIAESTYKNAQSYETNFPTYTGTFPEKGYYVSFSKGSSLFVSEAIRFASVADADSFYDYLYGRLPVGVGVYPTDIGDESVVIVSGENRGGLFRKVNYLVNNISTGGEFTSSEFTNYLQICEGRI